MCGSIFFVKSSVPLMDITIHFSPKIFLKFTDEYDTRKKKVNNSSITITELITIWHYCFYHLSLISYAVWQQGPCQSCWGLNLQHLTQQEPNSLQEISKYLLHEENLHPPLTKGQAVTSDKYSRSYKKIISSLSSLNPNLDKTTSPESYRLRPHYWTA